MRGSVKCCPYLAAPKNMCAKLKGSLRIVFFAWKRASGAPGEIRTPDLLLRRLSQQLRSSQNQLLILALVWRCAALSASTEHILNTISPRDSQGFCGGKSRASSWSGYGASRSVASRLMPRTVRDSFRCQVRLLRVGCHTRERSPALVGAGKRKVARSTWPSFCVFSELSCKRERQLRRCWG